MRGSLLLRLRLERSFVIATREKFGSLSMQPEQQKLGNENPAAAAAIPRGVVLGGSSIILLGI
jgi:hypothetical protein